MNSTPSTRYVVPCLAATLFACASAETSSQLRDARNAVHDAENTANAQAPDDVLSAKQTLEKAEQQADGSDAEKHYAYLADRQARLAIAHAGTTAAKHGLEDAEQRYLAKQETLRARAEERLARMQGDLADVRDELGSVRGRLASKEGDLTELANREAALVKKSEALSGALTEQTRALQKEREAREAAEARSRAAMKSLEEIAKVQEDARGITLTLSGSVLFRTGEATLLPIARDSLDRVRDALADIVGEDTTIVVEGHTDSVGSSSYNQRLSQERADAVRAHLVSQGLEAWRVRAIGKGESEPIADNATPEGRANNRRVEIEVVGEHLKTPLATR